MFYDVIIVGAGQSALSMGYFLKKTKLSFLILDKGSRVGDTWRNRYDSLVLFTPRSYSSLPGLSLEGNPNGFPTKDEVADYLEYYVQFFKLPIRMNTNITRIIKEGSLFRLFSEHESFTARNIIIATGSYQYPNIPSFSKEIDKDIMQVHSSQYKNQSQLNSGSVLVVGGGNSGSQIALDLSHTRETYLSISHDIQYLPLTIARRSIFWWLDKLGILKADNKSSIGRKLQRKGDLLFGDELKKSIKTNKVKIKPRAIDVREKNEILFQDMTNLKVNNIIWATGFIQDFNWIDIPGLLNSYGTINHIRGITNIKGLYFLGLPWQHRRGSSLLLGVGDDAEYLYQNILATNFKA